MNSNKRILLLLLCLAALRAQAQKAKLIDATEQCWSGGIAGRHGCNYTFTIDFAANIDELTADTIWIGERPLMLARENTGGDATLKASTVKNKTRFFITARVRNDDYEDNYGPNAPTNLRAKGIKPPKKYSGEALLCYRHHGMRRYYAVSKIMNKYPHQSYP